MIFRIVDRKKFLLTVLPILGLIAYVVIKYADIDWITLNSMRTKLFGFALLIVCLAIITFLSKKFGVDYEFQINNGQLFITKDRSHHITLPLNELVMLKVFENNKIYFVRMFDASGRNFFTFNNSYTQIPLTNVISFFNAHINLITCNEEYPKMGGRKVDYINKTYL
ncbi:hypothetical protein [Pedobacter punctiformis]|uniref:Uncharacterized protein n=1 Tax=Pedobacter punctiformis TaxID=3004097 RepID=A0ABT4LDC0_9SPHI|nr:hypothetical protein [Pedobacter sp. HCMS5-2]MCZ4245922.1 hypothetical protein [Pedobacter sp. HCMS5-2]